MHGPELTLGLGLVLGVRQEGRCERDARVGAEGLALRRGRGNIVSHVSGDRVHQRPLAGDQPADLVQVRLGLERVEEEPERFGERALVLEAVVQVGVPRVAHATSLPDMYLTCIVVVSNSSGLSHTAVGGDTLSA